MTIEKDKVVSIHYTLKGDDGEVIDSSLESQPLEYVHGRNYLLAKLEEQLNGKKAGDKLNIDLTAKDGYGEYNEALVAEVPRDQFDDSFDIKEGMAFQAAGPEGMQIVIVKKVSPDTITVDANHELAGKNLHFAIEIVDVRDATEEELSSGNVEGCGCGCGGDCSSGCGGGCGGGCSGGCC